MSDSDSTRERAVAEEEAKRCYTYPPGAVASWRSYVAHERECFVDGWMACASLEPQHRWLPDTGGAVYCGFCGTEGNDGSIYPCTLESRELSLRVKPEPAEEAPPIRGVGDAYTLGYERGFIDGYARASQPVVTEAMITTALEAWFGTVENVAQIEHAREGMRRGIEAALAGEG